MDRKPVSNTELADLGAFQGLIDRNGSFRHQAFNHNLGRNVRAAKLLAYMIMLHKSDPKFKGVVDCVAAIRQNFSSEQDMLQMGLPTGPMQAAHFLPGQVTVGGKPVWSFSKNQKVSSEMEFLFAEVEHLPLAFNQADTAAENKGRPGGLCAALAAAGQDVMNTPAPTNAVLVSLKTPYEIWCRGAIQAFDNAIASKSAKPAMPPLEGDPYSGYTPESIAARSAVSASIWNRDQAIRVLRYYRENQEQNGGWANILPAVHSSLGEIEAAFQA